MERIDPTDLVSAFSREMPRSTVDESFSSCGGFQK